LRLRLATRVPSLVAWGAVAVLGPFSAAIAAEDAPLPEPHPDLPPEYRQLLQRGAIAAIDEPTFVAASEADIGDDAWVLGVAIDGIAKAYSLNLLNRHEVVNDRFGELPVAAVW
jgi:hypothetical protein